MLIGHCGVGILSMSGGVATYIQSVKELQTRTAKLVYLIDINPNTTNVDKNSGILEVKENIWVVNSLNCLFKLSKILNIDILHLHTHLEIPKTESQAVIRTIHVHTPYCPSGSRFLKNWGQPCDRPYHLIGCLQGHLIDHCGSIRPTQLYAGFLRTWQEMQALAKIPAIANSQFVKEQMLRSGYLEDHLDVLLLPAPEASQYFPPPQEAVPHFLFAGRITPEKGWSWLLQAIARVKTPIHLDIAGTGNSQQNQAIRELVARLNLEEKITFHGWLNQEQVRQLMQRSRAVVFPSVWHEPAGLVSLEAAAAGRAVIASNVGGIPEYVGKLQNGLLVEPNDVQGLAAAIARLAEDWLLAQQLGTKGYATAQQHFTLEDHVTKLMKLYDRVINRQSKGQFLVEH